LSKKKKAPDESGAKVPAYIVTFSDMVTLLLTFFVMLLSLAQVQDPKLVNQGRDSFITSINGLGLGMFSGIRQKPDFDHEKINYFIADPDKSFDGRTIDARQEYARRAFHKTGKTIKALPSQIVASKINFTVTDIYFAKGEAVLDEQGKDFLSKFCLDLQQTSNIRDIKLCVLGLATDESTEKSQWLLSAKRAHVVGNFIKSQLSPNDKWPIYAWGAGSGGEWVNPESPISQKSQILIAILRTN